jgi:TonB family protein
VRQEACTLALVLAVGCGTAPSPYPTAVVESKTASGKGRIQVGSTLPTAGNGAITHSVRPVYPKAAKSAHIEGTVRFHVVISKTGEVSEIHLVSGNPMLVSAALEAVKQWRYDPCYLNGEPVEVKTTIDVPFTLSQ